MGGRRLRSLRFALRGLWWRRWSALAIWVVAIACSAIAAAGPAFSADSRDAVLQTVLRSAPIDADGTGVTVSYPLDGTYTRQVLAAAAESAFARVTALGYTQRPIVAQSGEKGVFDAHQQIVATLPLVYRQQSCAHVVVRAGRCVTDGDPRGILITSATARARLWHVGSPVLVGTGGDRVVVHIRGIYDPARARGPYWFADSNQYFGQVARFASAAVPRGDAALVPAKFWDKVAPAKIGANDVTSIDLGLRTSRVHASNLATVTSLFGAAFDRVFQPARPDAPAPSVHSKLLPLFDRAHTAIGSVATPILLITLQLVVLTWLVLYLVLASSAESRSGEIVLGKLRGLTPRETLLHTLLEPLLLVITAVPLGVLLCDGLLRTVGSHTLGAHVQSVVPATAWLAAGAAALGGAVACVVASAAVLRRSVIEQWRRTERRPGRRTWVIEAVIGALAVAGLVELLVTPAPRGGAEFLPLCVPVLLAVTAGLIGTRLVPLLARAVFPRTRATQRVALFVALRQVGRRAADVRLFLLISVATALLVFGVASRAVLQSNQRDRALTEVGADRVLSVSAPSGVDPAAVVARLDPAGREATAVYDGPLYAALPADSFAGAAPQAAPTLLVVDPARFAAVAYWRGDFGSHARLADELAPLEAAPPSPVRVSASSLSLTARITLTSRLPLELHAGLTDASGAAVDVSFGAVEPTRIARTVRFTAQVPRCTSGCLFRSVSLVQRFNDPAPPRASLVVTSLDAVGTRGASALLPALCATTWTSRDANLNRSSAEHIITAGGRLSVTFRPTGPPSGSEAGYSVVSDQPARVPALVTNGLTSRARPDRVSAGARQGPPLTLQPSRVAVLPRAGDAGVVLPRAWLAAARPDGYDRYRPNQVWLSAAAPRDFAARLSAAGLAVRDVQSAAQRGAQLGAQGLSFALTMLVFGSAAAGGLAVAGAITSLLIASRRRVYEMAAIRALGSRARGVLGSLLLELGLITAAAALVGLLAGLVGARAALARLPAFVRASAFPPVLLDLPVLLCVVVLAAVVVAMLGAAAVSGAALVRQASPGRLREAQA